MTVKCEQTTRRGSRCKRDALAGQKYCHSHSDADDVGRPTKLTKDVEEMIVSAIRVGNYAVVAAQAAGVTESTFYRWLDRGEKQQRGKYCEFRESIKRAEAEAQVYAVAIVRRQMPESWQAAMTYLERKFPQMWGRRDRHEVSGTQGGPIKITEEAFADPTTREVLHELVRRVGHARASQS